MRCFLSIGLRRFTGLGWFAHHAAGGRPGGCAMGTQGIGGVLAVKLAAPLVGGGRRRQSATGSIVPVAEFAPNSAISGLGKHWHQFPPCDHGSLGLGTK